MIVHGCEQGSPKWCKLRAGRPTASAFDRILTPGGKPSASADGYLFELLAEVLMGRPMEGPSMPWMQRGHALEADAATFYELQRDIELQKVGFVTNDAGTYGASPDRLAGEDGLVEIKVPLPSTHLQYMLQGEGGVDKAYRTQVQGQLLVTGRAWADVVSYHPELPAAIVRVHRDEKYIALLEAELEKFCARLAEAKQGLIDKGYLTEKPADEMEADVWMPSGVVVEKPVVGGVGDITDDRDSWVVTF